MKYYIIAGEASGDLHGSNLMRGLKEADPGAQFRFWGGELMAEVGGELVKDYRETAVMGLVEVVAKLRTILGNLKLCKEDILSYKPDVVILIDYPGFNFRIAKFAKRRGIKVFYYIAPKVWAWKEGRIKKLRRYVDRLFIIFPFEIEYFRGHQIEPIYRGNPLLDSIKQHPSGEEDGATFRERFTLDQRPIIALLPGSRENEIKFLLPRMTPLVERFPNHQFVIAGSGSMPMELYQEQMAGYDIPVIYGESYSIMRECEVAVLASGTASLEAALLNTPQVVCYGLNSLTFWLAKFIVKVKYVSLVNLILDAPLVKELLQHECNTHQMALEVERLLIDEEREKVLKEYAKVQQKLGGEGASLNIAKAMVKEYLQEEEKELHHTIMESPIGNLKLSSNDHYLISLSLSEEEKEVENGREGENEEEIPEVLKEAKGQLGSYFKGELKEFDLPLSTRGTQFQMEVWEELKRIPFGEVKSYGQVATLIGEEKASRAVGAACGANPIPIIIPCHRVVGADSKLTGFSLGGVEMKALLLSHEGVINPPGEKGLFDNIVKKR